MVKQKEAPNRRGVESCVEQATKAIKKNSVKAERILITHHVIRDGKITSFFDYHEFPNGDWGRVIQAIAIEGRQAELRSQTGNAAVK